MTIARVFSITATLLCTGGCTALIVTGAVVGAAATATGVAADVAIGTVKVVGKGVAAVGGAVVDAASPAKPAADVNAADKTGRPVQRDAPAPPPADPATPVVEVIAVPLPGSEPPPR